MHDDRRENAISRLRSNVVACTSSDVAVLLAYCKQDLTKIGDKVAIVCKLALANDCKANYVDAAALVNGQKIDTKFINFEARFCVTQNN